MAMVATIDPKKVNDVVVKCNSLIDAGEPQEACRIAEEHLIKNPEDAQVLVVLASVLKKAGRLATAYCIAQRIIQLRPDRPEAWSMLGNCAQQMWRIEEAEDAYRKASNRAQGKKRAIYLNNIGSLYIDTGRFEASEKFIREALSLDPDDMLSKHNLGLTLMAQGRWKEGWPNYSASIGTEARRNIKYMPAPGEPSWDGTKGKTVVVYGEQGLGDEICAASMLADVQKDCAKLIVDCDRRLVNLFKRSFPKARVYGTRWDKQLNWPTEDRQVDYSIAGFEVGKFYRNSVEEFPGTAYLTPDPERVLMWKALFASKKKPVIGIAWSGGTWSNAALHRHLPLSEWKPIFDAVDAHWISLQYKDASKEIEGTPVTQYPHATLTQDYDDTAALVAACDLVVGVQTSVNHLAGALGKEVWCLLPKTSQWRYGEKGNRIPWYSSMELFRQGREWPVKDIAARLKDKFK